MAGYTTQAELKWKHRWLSDKSGDWWQLWLYQGKDKREIIFTSGCANDFIGIFQALGDDDYAAIGGYPTLDKAKAAAVKWAIKHFGLKEN